MCHTGLILDKLIICLYHGVLASQLHCVASLSQDESFSWGRTYQTHTSPTQSPPSQLLSLLGFYTLCNWTCFNRPRSRYPTIRTDFMPQSPKLANSKLAYPALPISSHRNHSNYSWTIFPIPSASRSTQGLPHVTPPLRHGMPFQLENCE